MSALSYSVRMQVIFKYVGQLSVVLAALTVVPLLVSIYFSDWEVSGRYAAVIIGVAVLGMLLSRLSVPDTIQTNEAMVITALIFLIASLVLVWPMMAAGLSFTDAWFETVSGLTTTGLSTIRSVEAMPPAFQFARSWMQWTGGLGIVVLSLATMIKPGPVAKRIGDVEDYEKDLVGGTRANARRVLRIYVVLTLGAVLVVWPLCGDLFVAVGYALTSVSTGGFAPHDASLAGLPGVWSQLAVITFSLSGALPLIMYHRARHGRWRTIAADRQVRTLIVLGCLWTVSLTLVFWLHEHFEWWPALRHGVLNALSAQSTAGYSSLDMAERTPAVKLILILGMIIGGGMGSTAGGIKVMRLLIILRLGQLIVRRTSMPRQAVTHLSLGPHRLKADEIQQALFLVLLFFCGIVLSWIPFLLLDNAPLDGLFEVVSAMGTVGLSSGISDASLHPLLKLILCVDMLLGRLEIVAWLVFFYPATWLGSRRKE